MRVPALSFTNDLQHNHLHNEGGTLTSRTVPHARPSVAIWLRLRSLATRLSLFIALIVFVVVTSVAYLEVRSFERHVESDLADSARLGAQAAADAIAQRTPPLDAQDIRDTLHDLVAADPVLDAISVIAVTANGQARVFTSTSTEERAEAIDLAKRAIDTNGSVSARGSAVMMVGRPVPHRNDYAVVVTVGLESLLQTRSHGARIALGFVVPTIVLVSILVYVTVRQLVGRPLRSILETMRVTGTGHLGARTTLTRHDELGAIARGLNSMLDQMERFNQSLQERIDEATRDLSLRNAQLAAQPGRVARSARVAWPR